MTSIHGNKKIKRRNLDKRSHYSKYLEELREDFHDLCGYCGKSSTITRYPFEIDHFVPQAISDEKKHLYENLVYSCWQCNRKKGSTWPTEDADKPNDGEKGFVDPATDEYKEHLKRNLDGSIEAQTNVGLFMATTFKFNSRPIKEVWQAMVLLEYKDRIASEINSNSNVDSEQYKLYFKIDQKLAQIIKLAFCKE